MQVKEGEKCRGNEDKVWGDGKSMHCCSIESIRVLRNGLVRILHFQFVEREKSCCSPRRYYNYVPPEGHTHTLTWEKGVSAFLSRYMRIYDKLKKKSQEKYLLIVDCHNLCKLPDKLSS